MTDTTTIPQVDSQWTGNDPRVLTVTGITTINGKPNVQYQTSWPGRDDKGVGVADLDYFVKHHTEVT